MRLLDICGRRGWRWLAVLAASLALAGGARADQVIYDDALQNGWANFSWAPNNFTNSTPVHSGTRSISTTPAAFGAVEFGHQAMDSTPFVSFSFWIHGGAAGGQPLHVYARTNGVPLPAVTIVSPTANTWQQVTLSLAALGVQRVTNLTQFTIENNSGNTLTTFYLDDVMLVSDTTPPVVQSFSPAAGTVSNLTAITVTFSEPVVGVDAGDLRVNGLPASGVSGSGDTYTFTFAPPAEGNVAITWAATPGITDLGQPANLFDGTAPGATWQYNYADTVPPVVAQLFPSAGATVAALGQIEVTFSEPVLGVNAGDLLINGAPATNLSKLPGQPYVFQFPPPPTGAVAVAWAGGHGITDAALVPNAFTGGAWSYTVNPALPLPDLVINEILAGNTDPNGLQDADGDLQEWIEIFNRGTQPANLANWSLSDDPELPGLWVFPARTLNPGEYLVVFASGKDRRPVTGELHTNFKLAEGGEPLGLYSADSPRKFVSGFASFPTQRNNYSYGFDTYGALRYFETPTPGTANGYSPIIGIVDDVHVNVHRGFFSLPFTLTASCPTLGVTLRYTTNGADPTTTSALMPAAVTVSNTTLFRVAAFKANYLPSTTSTHTYFFNVAAGLRSLPAVSIVTATNNLYGPSGILAINGGYYNSNNGYAWTPSAPGDYNNVVQRGLAWERPASVEWIDPVDYSGFQVDCGLRVHGSDSQRPGLTPTSKFSYGLFFRSDYGPGKLDYPIFDRTTVQEFDHVILRGGDGDNYNPFIRDEIHRRLLQDMGQASIAGTVATVFVNGVPYTNAPWYNPVERVDGHFFESHLGGSSDWDVVGPNWINSGVTDGDRVDFNNLVSYVTSQAVTNPSVYTNIARWLDLTNFADYCILNTFAAMGDWPGNNWNAGKDRATTGPWRFVVWDAENGMGNLGRPITFNSFTNNGTEFTNGGLASVSYEVPQLYQALRGSPEFRLLWADRIQKHFFNGGALAGASISNRFNELRSLLLPIMSSLSVTMDTTILTWAKDRQAIYFSQMTPFGLTAYTNAPGFNQFGGRVAPGFGLTITNSGGTIYYTTNGSDPRIAFTGATNPAARIYSSAVPLNTTVTVRARTLLNGTNWSAATEATFTVGALGVPLRITELMYNPTGGSLYEYLELLNTSPAAVNVGGMYFSGITYTFPDGTVLPGGARLVLGSNTDTNSWQLRYPGVTTFDWFGGSLNNGGERIALYDRLDNLITSVDYSNTNGWPTAASGTGRSLEVINPLGDPDAPANWQASATTNGTPGAAPAVAAAPLVFLNELMAENFSAVSNGLTTPDWIELRNSGAAATNLAGWSLTDDGNARKFIFPSNTIAAGGYLTVWCDATTNTTPGLHAGFALGKNGETVTLYDAATNRVDALTYGLQITNLSVGRIGNAWTLTTPTPGATNVAVTLGSITNVVLNEWLANSAPGGSDWLELYNKSNQPVALNGIYLATSNVTFQVTSLSFIAAKGYVQLFADEGVGADHLDFKLPAAGDTIRLSDASGTLLQAVTYGAQTEDVSQGRLPDGTATITNFIGSASPGAANYVIAWGGPVINEVLARNRSVLVGTQIVDYVELYNPNTTNFNLSGMSLSVDAPVPGQFTFPPGTTNTARGYLLIKCDNTKPAATNLGNFNLGSAINGDGGGVYLFNTNKQIVNFIEYGPQVDDLPIGRTNNQWRLLAAATPGATNSAAAILGTNTVLRLNEWMAAPLSGDDWFELYNLTNRPVDISGIALSDDPSLLGQGQFRPPALTFIAANGFLQWFADGHPSNGGNHVNFKLDSGGDSLLIYSVDPATNYTLVDAVGFGAQAAGVSSGRFRDGSNSIIAFPGTASPGFSNYRPLTNLYINEALTHTDPPVEDAIEFRNPGSTPLNVTGWYVSNEKDKLRKYQITNTTPIPAGGYLVLYEYQFTNSISNAFTLNSAHGDDIWVTAITNGVETGERATVSFGAAFHGVSFGRIVTSQGVDFWPLTATTFGQDAAATVQQFRLGTGLSNAPPVISPVVINEIFYHAPGGTNGSDTFVELRNSAVTNVPLYDPTNLTNHWMLGGGIGYTFPANQTLASNATLLVVSFDPANATALAAFRARYGIATNVAIYGPFTGALANDRDTVDLLRPDEVQPASHPDAGFVPYVIVDHVSYTDAAPWPVNGVDGGGNSLQRIAPTLYGNEPLNWAGAAPTPGGTNVFIAPDTDGDGIPDYAELQLGYNPYNPADGLADADGDGMSNAQEYLAGTNPFDATSVLRFTQIIGGTNVVLKFPSVSNRTYSVLYKNALTNAAWQTLVTVPAGATNGVKSITDAPGTNVGRYYRLVTPAVP